MKSLQILTTIMINKGLSYIEVAMIQKF